MFPNKQQWLEILYKCIVAVLAIIFGYNQYQQAQLFKAQQQRVEEAVASCSSKDV